MVSNRSLALALACALAASPAKACSLALVMAMDVSASVDASEHRLQLDGVAGALTDPEVVDAIESVGGIWLYSFEWSGRYKNKTQIDWIFVEDAASAQAAATDLASTARSETEFPTALGYALGHASLVLNRAPERCDRRVIDVAGDGINNEGFGPQSAYRAFDFTGITVNALVIGEVEGTADYYAREVLYGPAAFMEVTRSFNDYKTAMKRKLLREVRGNQFAAARPSVTAGRGPRLPSAGRSR